MNVGDDGTCAAQDSTMYYQKPGSTEAVAGGAAAKARAARPICSMLELLRLLGIPEREAARWDCDGDRRRGCAFDTEVQGIAWRYGRNAKVPPGGKKTRAKT